MLRIANHEGDVRGGPKTVEPHRNMPKTRKPQRIFPEYRNRKYKETHYMKADVTKTWGLFCCFCQHVYFCCSNRNYQYKNKIKSLEWKRYIDDVFSSWDTKRQEIDQFILEANRHHPTINSRLRYLTNKQIS